MGASLLALAKSIYYPYPQPPPPRATEIPRGEEVQEKAISEGMGSCFPRLVLGTLLIFGFKIQDFPRHIIPNQ